MLVLSNADVEHKPEHEVVSVVELVLPLVLVQQVKQDRAEQLLVC